LIILGLLWIIYGLLVDQMFAALGVVRADDIAHYDQSVMISDAINRQDWIGILRNFAPGSQVFHIWLGVVNFLTGLSKTMMEVFLGWFGFWSSLVLLRYFLIATKDFVHTSNKTLLLVFLPSVVFWSTCVLKEAIVYWSICVFFTSMNNDPRQGYFSISCLTLFGILVGLALRPYTIALWITAICAIILFKKASLKTFLLISVLFLSASILVSVQIGKNPFDFAAISEEAENRSLSLSRGVGSSSFSSDNVIFPVSGAISLFFRPFPWEIRSIPSLMASVEIWMLSTLLVIGWATTIARKRRYLLKRADVQAALVVLLLFSCLFSYMPNEGAIARSRIQTFPAILLLVILPFASKKGICSKAQH
jgi:hypothetical protein